MARRLILALALLGSAIVAALTAADLYREYRADLREIEDSFGFVRSSYLPLLADSVSAADGQQVRARLEGLLRLRDMEFLGLAVDGGLRWSAGHKVSQRLATRRLPLVRSALGREVVVGELEMAASVDKVYARIRGRLPTLLLQNGIAALLAAGLVLLALRRPFARHLARLATHTRSLQESESSYRNLIAHVPGAVYRCEAAAPWRATQMSEGVQAICGYPAAGFLDASGVVWGELVLPEDRPELERATADAVASGAGFDTEYRIRDAHGQVRWVNQRGRVIRAQDGGALQIEGVIVDVTERRRVEEALRLSEERFHMAFHANPNPMAIARASNGRLVDANEGFARFTGYSRAEALGRSTLELGLWVDPAARERLIALMRQPGVEHRIETRIRTRSGELRDCVLSGEMIEVGGQQFALTASLDITERKQAESQIRELNATLEQRVQSRTADLEQANRELESFTYSASHDLRAPLRAINGYAQMLKEEQAQQLGSEGRARLERIIANTNKMGELIDDVLRYTRASRDPLAREEVDLDALARAIVAESREFYPAATVELRDLPVVSGDRTMLRQIFANLIDNALKFSSSRQAPRVEVACSTEDGHAVFHVSDNGAGFDMRYAGKLFGMFQRLHREPEYPGTGVGLALVRRLVERHGGRVWVRAEPDRGATFYFTLGG